MCVLFLIVTFIWWSETVKCDKDAKNYKIRKRAMIRARPEPGKSTSNWLWACKSGCYMLCCYMQNLRIDRKCIVSITFRASILFFAVLCLFGPILNQSSVFYAFQNPRRMGNNGPPGNWLQCEFWTDYRWSTVWAFRILIFFSLRTAAFCENISDKNPETKLKQCSSKLK